MIRTDFFAISPPSLSSPTPLRFSPRVHYFTAGYVKVHPKVASFLKNHRRRRVREGGKISPVEESHNAGYEIILGYKGHKKSPSSNRRRRASKKNSGSVLLSHLVTKEVPSAQEGLTSVFGMGTGVSPPLSPPKRKNSDNFIFAAHERNEKLWSSLTTH
jgi:hypothetical protein